MSRPATVDTEQLLVTAPVLENVRLIDVIRALDDAGVDAVDVNRRQATLDDVFLALTAPSASSPRTEMEVSA